MASYAGKTRDEYYDTTISFLGTMCNSEERQPQCCNRSSFDLQKSVLACDLPPVGLYITFCIRADPDMRCFARELRKILQGVQKELVWPSGADPIGPAVLLDGEADQGRMEADDACGRGRGEGDIDRMSEACAERKGVRGLRDGAREHVGGLG